jgi:hypothetical protein
MQVAVQWCFEVELVRGGIANNFWNLELGTKVEATRPTRLSEKRQSDAYPEGKIDF